MLDADREALARELSSLAEDLRTRDPAAGELSRRLGSLLGRVGVSTDAGGAPEPARVEVALALLSQFACVLDDLVWSAWADAIAPSSHLARRERLAAAIEGFLRGRPESSRESLEADLASLRLVTAATIAAIGRGGRGFAHHLAQRLSPEAIRASVPPTVFGHQARCWAHYASLARGLTAETLAEELMRAVSESARQLAEGRSAEHR